jgi:hypothetical protein
MAGEETNRLVDEKSFDPLFAPAEPFSFAAFPF